MLWGLRVCSCLSAGPSSLRPYALLQDTRVCAELHARMCAACWRCGGALRTCSNVRMTPGWLLEGSRDRTQVRLRSACTCECVCVCVY